MLIVTYLCEFLSQCRGGCQESGCLSIMCYQSVGALMEIIKTQLHCNSMDFSVALVSKPILSQLVSGRWGYAHTHILLSCIGVGA